MQHFVERKKTSINSVLFMSLCSLNKHYFMVCSGTGLGTLMFSNVCVEASVILAVLLKVNMEPVNRKS